MKWADIRQDYDEIDALPLADEDKVDLFQRLMAIKRKAYSALEETRRKFKTRVEGRKDMAEETEKEEYLQKLKSEGWYCWCCKKILDPTTLTISKALGWKVLEFKHLPLFLQKNPSPKNPSGWESNGLVAYVFTLCPDCSSWLYSKLEEKGYIWLCSREEPKE